MAKIIPVILSGGGGTRLWPLSTPDKPKQFLALTDERTMFQLTVLRTASGEGFADPLVVANAAHADIIEAQLNEIGAGAATLLLEPCARNTAPAIALAAHACDDPDSLLLVMPSDHVIADVSAFHRAIATAAKLAADGWLVTFGIGPTGPETGYGYIESGEELGEGARAVTRFVEKPDLENAKAMLAKGGYFWNGGIFLFRAGTLVEALDEHAPDASAAAAKAIASTSRDGNILYPDQAAFAASPSISIDYAVMERAAKVATVPVSMGWSDVGSWDALYDIGSANADGNVLSGNVRTVEAQGNFIRSDGIRVSALGVEGLIIVASGDEILILPRGRSQDVKKVSSD